MKRNTNDVTLAPMPALEAAVSLTDDMSRLNVSDGGAEVDERDDVGVDVDVCQFVIVAMDGCEDDDAAAVGREDEEAAVSDRVLTELLAAATVAGGHSDSTVQVEVTVAHTMLCAASKVAAALLGCGES